jgi:hypothetical protein
MQQYPKISTTYKWCIFWTLHVFKEDRQIDAKISITYLSMYSKKYRQIDATISKNIDNLQMTHFLDTPCTYLSMFSKKYRQIDATISKNIDNLPMAHFLDTPLHLFQEISTN